MNGKSYGWVVSINMQKRVIGVLRGLGTRLAQVGDWGGLGTRLLGVYPLGCINPISFPESAILGKERPRFGIIRLREESDWPLIWNA